MHTVTGRQWVQTWALCCFLVGHLFTNVGIVVSFQNENVRTKTACAGECHSRYSLECPYQQKIAIKDLQYYSKPLSKCPYTTCQNASRCCKYDPSDTVCQVPFSESKAYDVYQKCSGMQQCGWLQADTTSNMCNGRNTTNYIKASYKCVEDYSFLDICSNESLERETVNLIFNGSHMETSNRQSNRCVCILSTSDCNSIARLHFRTVDVRLHESNNISRCHPHAKFTITDTNGPTDYKCTPNHYYRPFHDIYFSSSSYARVSMYYQAGVYPGQVWLQVKATLPGQKVVISCGKQSVGSQRFCGPIEMIPTTPKAFFPPVTVVLEDVFQGTEDNTDGPPPLYDAEGGGARSKEQSELQAIIGGATSAVLVLIIFILVICFFRRRQKRKRRKAKEHDEESLRALTGGNVPPALPLPDTFDRHEGNYYETVGATNGKLDDTGGIISPSKVMETFTPGKKHSGQFFPIEIKPPLPPPTPKTDKKSPDEAGNAYHMPWDNSSLSFNRAQQQDLAYATSDEIQVLIQKMEHDRRCLNEGVRDEEQVVPNPRFYIHIDDYKIKRSPPQVPRAVEHDSSDEEEDARGAGNYEDIRVESDEDFQLSARENHRKSKVNVLKESSNENCCESEDTGYRSVGSPEHVMVSEDDYLIPGSIKSSLSEASKAGTLPKDDAEAIPSEVFDADSEPDEASTKF